MSLTKLQFRVLELSRKHNRSHIGSCLGALPLLDKIYKTRKSDDPVILSAGHAGLALYAVLEKYCGADAEDLLKRHGVHPIKDEKDGIWCSTGSLGQGITVGVGRAISDRNRDVWVYMTDGECAEGSVYEALRFAGDQKLTNLKVYINANQCGAYRTITHQSVANIAFLHPETKVFFGSVSDLWIPFLSGLAAHYHVMSEADWNWVKSQEVSP